MAVPFSYIARNLFARRLTTLLTAGGMALVVYVFATVLMLAAGLQKTLVSTGQDDNVVVIRRGSQTEVQSGIDRLQAGIVDSLPDIAVGPDGKRLVSREPVVLINLPKRSTGKAANVVIRGVTSAGLALRPQVELVEGRMFRPGTAEVIAGRAIATGFQARAWARRCASRRATGPSWASSTRAAPASTRRSGATPSRCCRHSAGRAIRRCSSGSPIPSASMR
jgi:hypothetical protein